ASLLIPVVGRIGGVGAAGQGAPSLGAGGIGDPYYPALGNSGYDARHYTLDLRVDVRHNRIAGTMTMEAVAVQTLSRLSLDFVGFQISTVTIDAVRATFTRQAHKLVIVFPHTASAGQRITIAVTYAGTPT